MGAPVTPMVSMRLEGSPWKVAARRCTASAMQSTRTTGRTPSISGSSMSEMMPTAPFSTACACARQNQHLLSHQRPSMSACQQQNQLAWVSWPTL